MLGLCGLRGSLLRPGLWGVCARAVRLDTPWALLPQGRRMLQDGAANRGLNQSFDNPTGGDPKKPVNPEGHKPNKTQQLKKVFKEYGAVAVSFHVAISLTSLGIFYLIVSSGLDVTALLLKVGFSEAVVQSKVAAGTSTFVLAYAVHKLFAPLRISITVISVPFIVSYLRRIGLFRPPRPSS
ncbi:protein FAM210B, mitochondrial [Spea bombifrons]|uniref:protein FAM210B, mitochondrial n=1 Tax=Spea bombifrons TaxID=233779 RepID=UPI002349D6E0|nr:protein FAM210B, mitochondrial [Spea bombifrons]